MSTTATGPVRTLVSMQLDPSIILVAGRRAASAGLAYAVQGRATLQSIDLDEGTVHGSCRGSSPTAYTTVAWIDRDRAGAIVYAGGECSCPVGLDCKHSVALYLTATAGLPRAPRAVELQAPAVPDWERTLGRIFAPAPSAETTPLALAFRLGTAPTPLRGSAAARPAYGTLALRPLRMGRRGAWIQTGAHWRDLQYGVAPGFPPEQARAIGTLAEFLTRNEPYYSSGSGYSAGSGWHVLDHVTSVPPWPLIHEAAEAGVALVEPARGHGPVVLRESAAGTLLDLVADGEDLRLTARFDLLDGPPLTDVLPVGPSAVGAVGRDPDGVLTVVGFRHAAPAEWTGVRDAGGVRVPAADRGRFETTLLPRIATRVGWHSSDGSFAPAPPPPPVLEVEVRLADDPRAPAATVEVAWRYGSAATGVRVPWLPSGADEPPRNREAEEATAEAAVTVLRDLPALVEAGRPRAATALAGRDVAVLVTGIVPRLAALPDVEVRMRDDAPDFRDLGEPEIRVGLQQGTDWFDLDVAITVGGESVPVADLITALARDLDTLFLEDGGYLRLDAPELSRLRELLEEARALTDPRSRTLRVSRLQLSWWEDLLALGMVEEQARAWVEALRVAATAPDAVPDLPDGLAAELRPYQLDGYGWLARLRRVGLGGVLADDMGLGKTLQSLAMILDARLERPTDGPFVVVAPTSVVPNWVAEAARFTPGLRVVAVTETEVRRGSLLAEHAAGADVLVTSYALFRLEYDDYAALAPSGLLLDEAQNAKNHQSRAFACAKQLPAPVKFAVTGTPMENNLGELWAMFAIVAPGLLGSVKQFADHYRGPIERGAEPDLLERLRRRIGPFLLRRTKDEVATDLPSKQEQRMDVELAPAHRRLYARQLQRERQRVLGLVDDLDANRIEVLSALTRLRQLAIDPSLLPHDGPAAPSSKLDVLMPLLEEAAAEGHRTLVFSQFTRFLDRVEARLVEAGLAFVRLDGSTRRRAEVVRSFTEGAQPVFLISLKAGGTGLNLAMADYCVLTDPWWNPATEAQAVDRAHRIGQTRPVVVYRLIAKDTIEEKVMALQEKKRALVSDVFGGDGAGAISAADIRSLLEE